MKTPNVGIMAACYTPAQVAAALNVTRRTVYNWIGSGQLKAAKAGPRLWLVSQGQLDSFLSGRGAVSVPASRVVTPPELPPPVGDVRPSGRLKPAQLSASGQRGKKGRRV